MEVHHHAHTHEKKSWKAYVWEFLMLFLAVFCGFLAEYQLEHVIEHQREKEYVRSFVEDIKQDTAELVEVIAGLERKLKFRDSLLAELGNPSILTNSNKAYYYTRLSYHFPDFIYNDRTIQQLKNSGGMRLIRNKHVSDSIMDYDAYVRTLFIHQQQLNVFALNLVSPMDKLFNKRLLEGKDDTIPIKPVPLLNPDIKDVEEFYNYMIDQKKGFEVLRDVEVALLRKGSRVIQFVQKEYQLEKE